MEVNKLPQDGIVNITPDEIRKKNQKDIKALKRHVKHVIENFDFYWNNIKEKMLQEDELDLKEGKVQIPITDIPDSDLQQPVRKMSSKQMNNGS